MCFRPHVWGSFFIGNGIIVATFTQLVFVPMFGDLFLFVIKNMSNDIDLIDSFRPHVWGSFFIRLVCNAPNIAEVSFRPHVWGSFFMR